MKKSVEQGMKTFDQCLFDLYNAGDISVQELQVNADAKGDLMLRLKLESPRFRQEEMGGDAGSQTSGLSFDGQADMEAAKKKAADEAAGIKPMPPAASAPPLCTCDSICACRPNGGAGNSAPAKPELKIS